MSDGKPVWLDGEVLEELEGRAEEQGCNSINAYLRKKYIDSEGALTDAERQEVREIIEEMH